MVCKGFYNILPEYSIPEMEVRIEGTFFCLVSLDLKEMLRISGKS